MIRRTADGLEFMGRTWDKLDAPREGRRGRNYSEVKEGGQDYPKNRNQGGVVYNAGPNPTCRTCGGLKYLATEGSGGRHRCACDQPDFPNYQLVGARAMQEWHYAWAVEALRVLKPGGYCLAFGGTRTAHRLACALEDAGFEIRDRILTLTTDGEVIAEPHPTELAWIYGSGFPKSLDVSKAVDKTLGAEGSWRQEDHPGRPGKRTRPGDIIGQTDHRNDENPDGLRHVYEAETPEAERWQGWGTALKPAHEPIVVARKPLVGTVAANVLEHGTGALNIDATRIGFASAGDERESKEKNRHEQFGSKPRDNKVYGDMSQQPPADYDAPGRWPANIVLSHGEGCVPVGTREVASDGHYPSARPGGVEITTVGHAGQEGLVERHTRGETQEVWECVEGCPVAELDAQSGETTSPVGLVTGQRRSGGIMGDPDGRKISLSGHGDSGGASRFFYCAKVSRAERNAGLGEDFAKRPLNWSSGEQSPGTFQAEGTEKQARNPHPTVKPIALMRWLIRLVTPPGGTVLDCFLGSGSTGCAATLESCVVQFVGIERDPDYMSIAEARISFWAEHGEDALRIVADRDAAEQRRRDVEDAGQLDLFAAPDPTIEGAE